MRVFILGLILLASSCSSPSRQCESQFDCFGDESCIDGECVTQIVITDDAQNGGDDASNVNTSDTGPNNSNNTNNGGDPDMSTRDTSGGDGGCPMTCSDVEICEDGACVPAPAVTVWTLNGEEVARQKTVEGQHQDAFDSVFVGLPHSGRNIQISVTDVSSTAPFSVTCDNYAQYNAFSFITTDNSWSDLDNLPDRWKGPLFTGAQCTAGADQDRLAEWNMELTTLTARRVVGTVEIEVEGAGPRLGETLRVTSTFGVDLDQN